MRLGISLFTAVVMLAIAGNTGAQPKREMRLQTRAMFGAPSYERDIATVPVMLEVDELCKRFVGISVIITEVHPIRPNENVRAIVHPYELPHASRTATRAEITFHVKRDAKYRIELEMVFEDAKGQLIHRMEKEEIHGERR